MNRRAFIKTGLGVVTAFMFGPSILSKINSTKQKQVFEGENPSLMIDGEKINIDSDSAWNTKAPDDIIMAYALK